MVLFEPAALRFFHVRTGFPITFAFRSQSNSEKTFHHMFDTVFERSLADAHCREAVIRLVEHHMLIIVRYGMEKLIYTHCHVITSHKLGRCAVQKQQAYMAYEKSPRNTHHMSKRGDSVIPAKSYFTFYRLFAYRCIVPCSTSASAVAIRGLYLYKLPDLWQGPLSPLSW